MDQSLFKYKRPFAAFMAILLFFLIITDLSIVSNQRRQMLNELEKHWQTELDLIGIFIVESFLKHEYANVEKFLLMSAKASDDIVEISATAPNNFVLAQYKREKPSAHTFFQKQQIQYGGNVLLDLKVVRDFEPGEKILRNLQLQLIAGSMILTIIMGLAIWFSIRRMALRPLETEIAERRHAEEQLQKVKDELEIKVQERTRELREINENLLVEISERAKAEESLREAVSKTQDEKAKLDAVIAAVGDGLSIQDTDYKVLYQNDVHKGFVGQHTGEFCYAAYEKEDNICEGCPVAMAFKDGKIHITERSAPTPAGRSYFEITASPLRNAAGDIIAGIEIVRDITDRKKKEQMILSSEHKFSKAFNSSPTLNFIATLNESRIRDVNDAFLKDTGYLRDEVVGRTSLELGICDTSDREKIYNMLRNSGIVSNCETRFLKKNGDFLTVLVSVEMIDIEEEQCVLAVALDITERKSLELQLLQSQKMEAVGQLAGGVAHDFNNILTAIMSNCYLLGKKIGEDDPAFSFINKIMNLSNNAAKITRELLVFSRRQHVELAPVDLNDIIRNAKDLIKNFLREDIELKTICPEEALTIMVDRNQIEQVLMNLATNARDALPEGGLITIKSEIVELDSNFIKMHGFGQPGRHALLSFSDTGSGMDSRTVQRIFEPFFTTKEVGKGTGLGLAIVYGIVKQHKGYINVYSEPGKGTTLRIYFPETGGTAAAEKTSEYSQLLGKGETILFAEDEQEVRESTIQILEEYNYRVIEAVDGNDAVEKFLMYKDKIDLLVFDVIMPKKSGKKALEEIRGIKPGIKAIFTSGYASDIISGKDTGKEDAVFISKPLLPEDLLSKIRESLS